MVAARNSQDAPEMFIDREHTWIQYIFILSSISLCITVDILQYSMPLAFLPSVLEDRGHDPMEIATAIGVYYWTGLLGGIMLTSYEVWKLLYAEDHKMQGFVGAFLFFYVFLLNVSLFKGQQQVLAMTCASCATVLAELAGPLLGSILFDNFGQRAVFWFLGAVSFMNQGMLAAVYFAVRGSAGSPASLQVSPVSSLAGCADEAAGKQGERPQPWWRPRPGALAKLQALCQNPTFVCACLSITMAGVIKGSVEEMLPFHADHRWRYDPMKIGQLFCTTAVAYFVASFLVAQVWTSLGRLQNIFSSQCIVLLGAATWLSFHVFYYYKDETALFGAFAVYGFMAGLAFTSAAQLIGQVVEAAEGHAKDAANGIWNTMWEFGGSTGFFLGGFFAHHYNEQMTLTSRYLVCTVVAAICMILVGRGKADKATECKFDKVLSYGATA